MHRAIRRKEKKLTLSGRDDKVFPKAFILLGFVLEYFGQRLADLFGEQRTKLEQRKRHLLML
jgi:hypothetical protein